VLPEHAAAYRAVLLSTRQRRTVIRETLMMARLATPRQRSGRSRSR